MMTCGAKMPTGHLCEQPAGHEPPHRAGGICHWEHAERCPSHAPYPTPTSTFTRRCDLEAGHGPQHQCGQIGMLVLWFDPCERCGREVADLERQAIAEFQEAANLDDRAAELRRLGQKLREQAAELRR